MYLFLVAIPTSRRPRSRPGPSGVYAPIADGQVLANGRYGVAVVVVHHARKGAAHARAGQALRGSSEFHAWGDSNLYLRRTGDDLTLSIEHRAAASPSPLAVGLAREGDALALEIRETHRPPDVPEQASSVTDSIEHALASASDPVPLKALRQMCRARTKSVCDALATLRRAGRVVKVAGGYTLVQP